MQWIENDIRIFKLELADAAWLSAVAKRAYFDTYTHFWFDSGAWYAESCFNIARLEKELADENAIFFGVESKGEGLGFLKINKNYPLSIRNIVSEKLSLRHLAVSENQNALELERIYLTKNGQGRGIGQQLVERTLNIARSLGKDVVWLKAMDTSIAAIGFYEKMGFEIIGRAHLTLEKMKPVLRGMLILKKKVFELSVEANLFALLSLFIII